MKPIYLKMSAFGPYSGVESIDFKKLDKGLFLIMGDTGSGKTTIFDGIVFALYGEASGNIRQSNMLRSDFADEETDTFVEFIFQNNGKEYYIKRSPEYPRKKKRGEGYTKKSVEALMKFPDGRIVSKYSDVTKEVTDILGVTKEQFTNIAMIAQGDFMKLILANTEERSKIFRDIFNTRKFLGIQKQLESEMKTRYISNKEFENSIFQYEGDTICDDNSIYYDSYKKLLEDRDINVVNDFIELLVSIISEDEENKKSIKESKSIYEKLSDILNELIGLYKENELNKKKLQELDDKSAINERSSSELQKEIITHEADRATRDEKYIEVSQLNSKLEEYEESDRIFGEKQEYEKKKKSIEDNLKKAETIWRESEKKLQELKDINIKVNDNILKNKEYEISLNEYVSKNKLLSEIIDKYKETEELKSHYKVLKKDYQTKENILKLAKEEADRKEILFFREQAGIMARDLSEGEKCPVCGSVTHPKKAMISINAPTQEEVKNAKSLVEDNTQILQDAADKCSHTKGLLEKAVEEYDIKINLAREVQWNEIQLKELQLNEYKPKEIQWDIDLWKNGINLVSEIKKKIEEKIAEMKINIKQSNDFISRYDNISELIEKEKKIYDKAVSDTEKYKTEERECEIQLVSVNADYDNIKKGLKFSTKGEAKNEIKILEKFISSYDKKSKEIDDKNSRLINEKTSYAAEMKLYEKEKKSIAKKINEKLKILDERYGENKHISNSFELFKQHKDIDIIRSIKSDVEKDKDRIDKSLANCEYRIKNNKNTLSKIKSGMKDREEVINEYRMYKKLSDVSNGMITGKEKITFERYVQGTYFEYIIKAANKRLAEMTDGRYELLKRKDNNLKSQAGLELDIKDAYTGKTRSVNTLSGGEAFKASLSMALGLSDVVQRCVGGIKIDSMFIDEGFGSLDKESLEQAIGILSRLGMGDRMIGIISHMNELGEWIDKKIVIEKSHNGSRVN